MHEAIEQDERVDFEAMFSHKNLFVLEVSGDSMIDAQIADGDYVVVRRQRTARDGQIAVVQTDEGEATLKRFYLEADGRVRLQPANSAMQPIFARHDQLQIQGKLLAVLRKY